MQLSYYMVKHLMDLVKISQESEITIRKTYLSSCYICSLVTGMLRLLHPKKGKMQYFEPSGNLKSWQLKGRESQHTENILT